jgi:hypothetical protein
VSVRIAATRRSRADTPAYLATLVDIGAVRYPLAWAVRDGVVTNRSDPIVAATLLPAMRSGGSLMLDGPVSPQLLSRLTQIQSLFRAWDTSLTEVDVVAPFAGPTTRSPRAAAFFSGGIDSYYTALSHIDEIDALIFVHGFDIRLERRALIGRISGALQGAARDLGKKLIEVRTDIKRMSRAFVGWSWFHGSALASVALLMAPMFGKVYVPSSLSRTHVAPYGSHPALDPLWSTDAVEVVYEGFDTDRFDKAAEVARSPAALRWLRVCNERDDDGYNCGRCEKCLRTMVTLELLGALRHCQTLPQRVDPMAVRRLSVVRNREFWEQNISFAESTNAAPDLVDALRAVLEESRPWRPTWTIRWSPPQVPLR